MLTTLEVGVVYTGIGCFCCSLFPKLYQQDLVYSGTIIVYIILTAVLQHKITNTSNLQDYRISDPGLHYCLILPLTLYSSSDEGCRLLTILVHVTLIKYITLCQRAPVWYLVLVLILLALLHHILMWNKTEMGLTVLLCLAYLLMLQKIPVFFPKSFSYGELSIVCQIYIYMMSCILRPLYTKQETPVIEKGNATIFITLNILVLLMYILRWYKATLTQILTSIFWTVVVVAVCVVCWFLPPGDILVLIQQLFGSTTSIILLLWWIFCSVLSILIVCYYGNEPTNPDISSNKHEIDNKTFDRTAEEVLKNTSDIYDKPKVGEYTEDNIHLCTELTTDQNNGTDRIHVKCSSSIKYSIHDNCSREFQSNHRNVPMFARKYFHVVIICVFIPGLLFHPRLLYVASGAATALFVLIETVRIVHIYPFSCYLNKYLRIFLDKQDQGDLILTPIYLLIGCSLPLWLIRPKLGQPCSLVHYSGLLSVGVGDAAASIIGKKYGRHTWPGLKKTVEGTVAAFLSQFACLFLLHFTGVPGANITMTTLLILMLISCLEAFTQHIDNLVVPVYATMLLSCIDSMAQSV